MSNPISLRACSQSLFLIAAIFFQGLALPGRNLIVAKGVQVAPLSSTASALSQDRAVAQVARTPRPEQIPDAPSAAALAATNRDSFPNHGDGKAHQGDTITYSVAVTNTGDANATSVNYTNTVDQNTSTLVGGSPTIQFTVTGDTYAAIGNVKVDSATIAPGSGKTVLENDTTNGATLTGFGATLANANGTVPNDTNTVATANGGTVVMSGTGSFTYNPGPGFTGADSFWYTLTNNTIGTGNPTGFPSGAARVTINVTTPIWFVDQAAAAGGDGRLATPFNCLGGAGCFNAVNNGAAGHPKAGDFIFLYKSSGAPAAFTGGVDLLNNQKLIGEGASQSLDVIVGVSVPAGSTALPTTGNAAPVLTTGSFTDNIRLGAGNSNTLRGFTVGDSGGVNGDSSDISGTNIGTLTVSEVTLNGTGRALRLTGGGTLAATFISVTSTKASGEGINLGSIGGNATFGSTTISNTGNQGINITGSSLTANFGTTNVTSPGLSSISISSTIGNITFGATTLTNGIEGVNLNGNSAGTRTFGSLSITGVTANGFNHSNNGAIGGGNVTVTGTTTISCAGNAISVSAPASGNLLDFQGATSATVTAAGPIGVSWAGAAGATMQYNALTIQTNGGIGLNATTGGTVTVTNGTGTINNTTQAASAIIANGIALNANFAAIKSSGGTNGVSLTNVTGTSNFGVGALSGATGSTFLISGQNGSVTYNGTIAQATAGQRVVDIQSKTGGTVTLGGAISSTGGTGTGIILNSNTGATINFTGGIALTTNANAAFTATGGGTVNVTGTNTITTTTGTAVNIANTTIGGSNVTFQSVAHNGNNTAIILNTTGAGQFLITGTSTTAGSGGTIQNIVGADAITLNITGGLVTLKNMIIQDITASTDGSDGEDTHSNVDAIHGQTVNGGLTLNNVTIQRISDNGINGSVNGAPPSSTVWTGLTITNCTFANTNRFNTSHADANNESAVHILGIKGTVSVTGTSFSNAGSGLRLWSDTSGTLDVTIQSNTFTTLYKEIGTLSVGLYGIDIRQFGSLTSTVRIGDTANETNPALGNTFTNGGDRASIDIIADVGTTGAMKTSIAKNTFTVTDHSSPGVPAGSTTYNFPQGGVLMRARGTGNFEAIFAANVLNQVMHADGGLGQLSMIIEKGDSEFIVRNNTFQLPWDAPIELRADGQATGQNSAKVLFTGNTYVDGTVGDGTTDLGGPSPYTAFYTQVRNNGRLDLTIQNEASAFGLNDTSSGFANSIHVQTTTAGDILNLFLQNLQSPRGYQLKASTGTSYNLYRNGSVSGTAQGVLQDSGNTGGGGADGTVPPTTNLSGAATVTLSAVAPLLPSIVISQVQPEYRNPRDYFARDMQVKPASTGAHAVKVVDVATARNVDRLSDRSERALASTLANNLNHPLSRNAQAINGQLTANNRSREVRSNHAVRRAVAVADQKPLTPQSGGTVNLSVAATITPGSTVVLTYQVTVNNAAPAGASSISNQGTVTATGGISVLTDDPDVGGASDPTVTLLLHPTAANGVVSGRITDANGAPVAGAVVNLSGGQARKLITDANGNYQFENVDTGAFYTVTPSRANFNFNPFNRSFSQAGNKTEAAFTGTSLGDNTNPLDTAEYFVRQQYVDVLGREPDEAGFNYWSDQLLACGEDASCTRAQRTGVAAAFFIENEAQSTGSFIYDVYAGALGRRPAFSEYAVDRQQVIGGDTLDTAKTVFAREFVQRAEFSTKYQNAMTAEAFVEALIQSAQASGGSISSERSNLIGIYNRASSNQPGDLVTSRAAVVRTLADNAAFKQSQYNKAFVLTEYFAYLKRDIDPDGYNFWVGVLNTGDVGNYRGMVCSFVTSTEYQNRFSQIVSRSNGECGQ